MIKYFCITCLFIPIFLKAQQFPVYNHYYDNPYLLNPAEAGSNGYVNFTLNHRQQWRGIEGAPVVSTFTFEAPFDYKPYAFGVQIHNFKRGLITTNNVLASYAYTVYFTKGTTLHFGLSAGVTGTAINLDKIDDPSDPILAGYLQNNMQPIGNFGLKLKSKSGINLGISLPKLFKTSFLSSEHFNQYTFSPFDEVLFVGYYKKQLDRKIVTRRIRGMRRRVAVEDAYAPLQLYFLYRYSQLTDERIEALATLHLNENFWLGGSYRLNYGISGIMGFNIGNFSFGYAYEPANQMVEGFALGTHEVQVTIRIGERKKLERSIPLLRTLPKTEKRNARYSTNTTTEDDKGVSKLKKHYVVLKSFKDFHSADKFVRRMKERELYTDIFFNKADNRYHVYSFQTYELKEANKQKRAVEELTNYKSVTIISIEQE